MWHTMRSSCVVTAAAILLTCGVWSARAADPKTQSFTPALDRPQETSELLVFLQPGTDVNRFAQDHGLVVKRGLRSNPDAYVLAASSVNAAAATRQRALGDRRLRAAYVNRRVAYAKLAFVPNDPYFHRDTPVAGFPGQWHLINEYTPGLDAGVQGAWSRDITGSGVVIGIVDDCLQTSHPDLASNYWSADSWDFGQDDNSPNPVYEDDMHGVSTSGVAGARGGNGVGVTGAAPYARLAGLRCDFYGTEDQFVDATLYHSSGGNTNIKVKNHSYGAIYPWTLTPADESALLTSAAAGTIHCFAAGNSWSDANQWDLQNSPGCICVAALGSDGKYAGYSNYGACVFVTCPSSSDTGFGITTTDRMGESWGYNGSEDPFPDSNFTSVFGGTSSASPLAAGVMALGKQVQPNLNGRFAKHLLAMTSDIVDPTDTSGRSAGGWKTNAGGYHFNQNYGFGLINADAFTSQAIQYTGVSPETTQDTGLVTVSAAVPDNNPAGISRTYTVSSTTPAEVIEVYLKITISGERTELDAWLTSPSGTRSRLLPREWPGYFNNINWWFTTNEFWGENPSGTWTLTITDWAGSATATWSQYRVITHMGTLVTSGPPFINAQPLDQEVPAGDDATFTVQAIGTLPLSYQWQRNESDLTDGGRISGATTNTLQISDCEFDDAGRYRCAVTNSQGDATSNEADLTVVVMTLVESRSGGRNYDHYSEVGTFSNTSAKSTAAGTTAGIGGRWASMDRGTYGVNKAVYSFTPSITGSYDVSVTWPASTSASSQVEHLVTHAGGTASVLMDQNNSSNPAGSNHWNSLGQYVLGAGTAYTVTQTNETYAETGTLFQADAVKWQLVSRCEDAPTVTSIDPNTGPNDQVIDDALVQGTSFVAGQTSVKLVKASQADIVATDVNVTGGNSLTCDLDLNGAVAGAWDLVVSVPNCPPAILTGGFTITPSPCPDPPTVTSIDPNTGQNTQTNVGVTVYGSSFAAGQTGVKLVKPGLPDIIATDVNVVGGGSLTCSFNLWGAVTGPWNVVVTVAGCPPVTLPGGFTITASGTPTPLAYMERWDTYATGTSDPDYVATWVGIPGEARHSIFNTRPSSSPNSLLVNNLPGGPFGITNDLSAELQATVPGAVEVVASDANALDVVFYIHMNSTSPNLKYGDAFIELSKGDVHAPTTPSSPTVIPVLAFGVTYGINGATKCPYFFDGRNWIQVSGATSVTGWNWFKMTVQSTTCLLTEYKTGTYVGTMTRQYTGGFDRVSLRTVNNQGDYRSLDDVYLTGGLAMPPAAPTITQHPAGQGVCRGAAAAFTVSASGEGTVAYQWQHDNVNVANGGHYSGVGTPALTVTDVDSSDAGDYRCIVSNVGGSVSSNPAGLAIVGRGPADFDLDCDVDQADYDLFEACSSGPAVPPSTGCEAKDLDWDGDIDQSDFGLLQRCYSGEGSPADPDCAG